MSKIKSKNTHPEQILAKAMWSSGLRYRKQYKIIGKPDFVFQKGKVAIFCDGEKTLNVGRHPIYKSTLGGKS